MKNKCWEKNVKGFIKGLQISLAYKATAQIEYEISEMENSFSLMIFGNLIGFPGPTMLLTLELLPYMNDELEHMILRAAQTGNGLSELASIMGEP